MGEFNSGEFPISCGDMGVVAKILNHLIRSPEHSEGFPAEQEGKSAVAQDFFQLGKVDPLLTEEMLGGRHVRRWLSLTHEVAPSKQRPRCSAVISGSLTSCTTKLQSRKTRTTAWSFSLATAAVTPTTTTLSKYSPWQ